MKYNNRKAHNGLITDGINNIFSIVDFRRTDELDNLLEELERGEGDGGGGTGSGDDTDNNGNNGGQGQGQGQDKGGGNNGGNNGGGGGSGDGNPGGGDDNHGNVTVDEIEYTLDKDGNALDKDKKVVYTKEQLEAFAANAGDGDGGNGDGSGNGDDLPLVDEVVNTLGYTITGEDGKPKTYEDSVAGIIEYVKDVIPELVNQGANQFLEQNKKVKAYFEHLATGGTDEQFFNAVREDWKAITLDEKNPTQHKDIIKKYLMKSGMDADDAELTAKTVGDSADGAKAAKKYLDLLVKQQEADEAKITSEYNKRVKEQQDRRTAYLNGVNEIVLKKGQLNDFIIPEADRKKFIDYLFKPVKDGKTQDDLDQENDPLEVELQLAYLRYRNFDIGSLVKRTAKSAQVKNLRDRFKGNGKNSGGNRMNQGNNSGTGKNGNGNQGGNADVSLETLYNT